ncbi:MAG: GNAT family N-acetyltransferase [bacterium]|nr:GNAT family N-acetyltransferase [bacterium]
MLRILTGVNEYMSFINEVNSDPDFSDPMLQTQEQIQCNLLDASGKPTHQIWGIFDGEEIAGLFVFLVLEEESYLEMLVGLSRSPKAYEEMLSFLKAKYKGFQADFVYNPANSLLHRLLQDEGAEFYPEQQKMVLKEEIPYQSNHQVVLYSPEYREQYLSMHQADGYWTAEKVIAAADTFRIFLALENGAAVGYLDVTYQQDENEPYDLFVKEEYRGKGYGKAMLAKAVELNRPKAMLLLADIDNAAAIGLCESVGFVKAVGENSITAQVLLR